MSHTGTWQAGTHGRAPRAGPCSRAARPVRSVQEQGSQRPPSLGMLVCKLPLYQIIMRCLGYQQISRRLGREGCGTIRKCQLAASSFCRSLNPIFPTCISAAGTGPPQPCCRHSHCYGNPAAPRPSAPTAPGAPSWHIPSALCLGNAGLGTARWGGLCAGMPAEGWVCVHGPVGRGLGSQRRRCS